MAKPRPRILAFAGSTRTGSYNKKLVRIAARGVENSGARCTVVDLRDHSMPLYDGDLEASEGLPEAARSFRELLHAHDGLLIAAPENNSSISAVLKNAIDWASRSEEATVDLSGFQGKVVGLLAASPGPLGGLRGLVHVRSILENIGCIVLPEQITLRRAAEAFDDSGDLADPKWRARVEQFGAKVAEFVRKIHCS